MKRPATAVMLPAVALLVVACTSNRAAPHDPGKVVLVGKQVMVPGKLYATKGRSLYRFSGTHLTPLLAGVRVKDPTVSADGARLAIAQLQDQSSTIVVSDKDGRTRQTITPSAGPEGPLWAFAPHYSNDGQRIVYLTDRGKQPSSPQNLQPNDLGIWSYDLGSGHARRLVAPIPYTGGDSDPVFRPGVNDQLLFATYLYGGAPLQPVARLTWMLTATMATFYLSPDMARNFQATFSPDGRFVAYIHAGAGSDDLYVMPLGPTFSRESWPYPTDGALLLQSGIISQPVWAPDGRALAFLRLVNGSFDLFILPVSTDGAIHPTGQANAVTPGSFLDADSRLAWSP